MNNALCVFIDQAYLEKGLNRIPYASASYKTMVVDVLSRNFYVTGLTEDKATRNNVLSSLDTIYEESKPGSWNVFYFCGHGELTSEEEDHGLKGRGEGISLIDGIISDTEYTAFIRRFAKKTDSYFVSILDCCFSSGMVNRDAFDLSNHLLIASAKDDRKYIFEPNKFEPGVDRSELVDTFLEAIHITGNNKIKTFKKRFENLEKRLGTRIDFEIKISDQLNKTKELIKLLKP